MKPGAHHLALLQAAQALKIERAASGQGATLQELVSRSCLGYKIARATLANLRRRGKIEIVRTRRVAWCNKPVSEYLPAIEVAVVNDGRPTLDACLAGWLR